jgi:hypothetical protein
LPRGLGDDPLSKKKKRSSTKRNVPPAPETSSPNEVASVPTSTPSVQSQEKVEPPVKTDLASSPTAAPASVSYNDVFFQRRSSEEPHEEESGAESPTTMPSAAVALTLPAEPPQVTTPAVIDSTVSIAASPQQQAEIHGETSSSVPAEVVIEPAKKIEQVQPRAEEEGFFKRIFGRFRQH